jgi:hypothetical protein
VPSFVRPFVGRTLHKFGGVLGAQVIRNMRLIGVGALVIGWVLGIALMRQAERDAIIWEDRTEEYERKKEMDALKRDAKDIDKD